MLKKTFRTLGIFLFISVWFLSGWPPIWQNPRIPPKIKPAYALDTGFKTTTSTAAVASSAGDNNGFETTYGTNTPKDTTTDNAAGLASANTSSGAATDGCTTFPQSEDDQHDFYNFGFSVPANSTINGIEIGTQLLLSSNSGTNLFCFALSWNNGTSWTAAKSSGDIGTSESAVTLGGAADPWGRTWSPSELGNANFRIRVMLDPSATLTYTFSMDLLQVKTYYTPWTTTIADGTNPSNAAIAPGASITDLDAFTLTSDAGTDTVTAATVTLGPANAYNNIAQVDLTDNSDVARCTAVTNPTSNTISFTTCTSNGGIPVSTSPTTYKVRITPKTHANMPSPSTGASYDTTGTVTSFTSTNSQSGTDSGSATVTIDNASPNGATSTSGSAGNTNVTINWTTSNSSDFATTNGSVVLKWAAASAGDAVPLEGKTDYVAGNTIVGGDLQTATVACVISSAASTALSKIDGTGGSTGCTTSALTNGTTYSYKVFQVDTNGNYDVGVSIGSFTPVIVSITITTDGTVAYGYVATGATKSTVQLSDTQTAQNDGSGTETFNIKTSNATGGTQWTLGASAGTNIFVHEFSTNGGAGWTAFTTADSYQTLATGIAASGTQNFDLKITVPNSSSDYQQKTIAITVQAVAQ